MKPTMYTIVYTNCMNHTHFHRVRTEKACDAFVNALDRNACKLIRIEFTF